MRMIDADAYKSEMKTRQDACEEWRDEAKAYGNEEQYARAEEALATFIEAKLTLDKMPTIEVEPVKHGRWIEDEYGIPHCSECKAISNSVFRSYCPNCGAKMFDKDIDVHDKNVGKMDEVEDNGRV